MSEPYNPHPKGFVGVTDEQLALRPLFFQPNRFETINELKNGLGFYDIDAAALENRPVEEELLLGVVHFDKIAEFAVHEDWKILPEARHLMKLTPVPRDMELDIEEEPENYLAPAILPKSLPRFNLISAIAPLMPAKLAKQLREEAGGRCECCARVKGIDDSGCQPRWKMHADPKIAELSALEVLCTDCAAIVHFIGGSAKNYDHAEHLALVNGLSESEANDLIAMAKYEWREWSRDPEWTYDLIELHRYRELDPPDAARLEIGRDLN